MSVFSYLDRLRSKSEGERRRLALLTAVAVTLVIAGLWALNLQLILNLDDGNKVVTASPLTTTDQGLISSLSEVFTEAKLRISLGWQSVYSSYSSLSILNSNVGK